MADFRRGFQKTVLSHAPGRIAKVPVPWRQRTTGRARAAPSRSVAASRDLQRFRARKPRSVRVAEVYETQNYRTHLPYDGRMPLKDEERLSAEALEQYLSLNGITSSWSGVDPDPPDLQFSVVRPNGATERWAVEVTGIFQYVDWNGAEKTN